MGARAAGPGADRTLKWPACDVPLILRQPSRVRTGSSDGGAALVSRVERTPLAAWWWTVDGLMLTALIMLMLGGIVLSLAASPPVANRLSLEPFYFVHRHVLFLIPALAVMLITSFLPGRHIRRLALVAFIVSLVLVAATLLYGAEVKGARRWLVIAGINIQPAEFLKPALVLLIDWLLVD